MVGEVVSREVLDPIAIAEEMSDRDPDELTVLGRDRQRLGPVHQQLLVVGSEERGGDDGGDVVTGVGAIDDLRDGGGPDRELVDHMSRFGRHGCIVGGVPDTALTPTYRRTLQV